MPIPSVVPFAGKPYIVRLIERHKHTVMGVPSFLSNRPPAIQEARARRLLEKFPDTPPHDLCIVFEAPDGPLPEDGGYMRIGADAETLARDCATELGLE